MIVTHKVVESLVDVHLLHECRREVACEFCDRQLPDWKKTLTPIYGANAPAVMNVNFDGRTYSFEVWPSTCNGNNCLRQLRWHLGELGSRNKVI